VGRVGRGRDATDVFEIWLCHNGAVMPAAETLTRALEHVRGVRLAVMFGSAARRTDRSDSDIDVALLLDQGSELSSADRVALERAVGRPVDVVLLHGSPPLLRLEIARDGRLLIEREPHAWADFRARAMIDWWDWAPTARMMHAVMRARLEDEAGRGPS
jgi:predicted nucleotidyltransferase